MTAFVWFVCLLCVVNVIGAARIMRQEGVDGHALSILLIYGVGFVWSINILLGGA